MDFQVPITHANYVDSAAHATHARVTAALALLSALMTEADPPAQLRGWKDECELLISATTDLMRDHIALRTNKEFMPRAAYARQFLRNKHEARALLLRGTTIAELVVKHAADFAKSLPPASSAPPSSPARPSSPPPAPSPAPLTSPAPPEGFGGGGGGAPPPGPSITPV